MGVFCAPVGKLVGDVLQFLRFLVNSRFASFEFGDISSIVDKGLKKINCFIHFMIVI